MVKSDGNTRVVMTTQPSSKSEEDLRIKLNAKKAAKLAPKDPVDTTIQKPLPPQKEKEIEIEPMDGSAVVEPLAEVPPSIASVAPMETECFSSPPNRRSRNAKHQRYTRWDGKQAVILSPPGASSLELNGPDTTSISTSPPAAHLAALRQIFNLPSTSEEPQNGVVSSSPSVEEQFKVLAQQSRTVAGCDTTCTSSFVCGSSISRAFYRERLLCTYSMPATSSFAYDAKASVVAPTPVPLKSAKHRSSGGKALLYDDDLDDTPLAERRRRKRHRLAETIPSDDIDFCLAGSSVVDPLLHLEALPPLPSSPTLKTSAVVSQVSSKPPSEEVTIGVLSEGYASWASVQPSPLPSTTDQTALNANVKNNNIYSWTGESESPPGSSSQSNNNSNNNISAESEIPPVSSLAIVPYHDLDSHDTNQDTVLGSDTPPVTSSSLTIGPSNFEPISPALPSVESGAIIDANASSSSPESLREIRALRLMYPTLPVFHFLEHEF